ncbi:MAG: Trypsin [Candidatus Methanoperedens nitroreducens]|uniref:Trypsin n=1 Tax=Candidatus Methanoperedens nitratireducens TaxID=1392998 RepID=A0A0P8CLM2_9EURY|nr:serine protease [Candidatus Methanoperedens sp. BLZ2]KAB2943337.1 MAG: trypsin-like serine protease [Candidatus Methanoperedens sp.]KPQ44142.1 MAG: Trypsin [Candidatus Methanoperedens sp. BLZ1]MBZ0173889.1 trypsin-like peptidase domain-containing protein [Candidatus Methanoperedens nitroreducens]CAG0970127.1 Bacterial leucyl aminopeptidase [Methanosarcinales archaeon]MCX9077949.1 serine protease [Candidatus Methanoperedens sp.]
MSDGKNDLIKKLNSFEADQLLGELKSRPKKVRSSGPFQDVDSATIAKVLKDKQKAIYGVDDRKDLFLVDDQGILNDADCVVSLFQNREVVDNGDGTSTLAVKNFGTEYNLCNNERFREQPTGAFCSGFLVAPDLVATAGHCVNPSNVTNILFVFGFRMVDETTPHTNIDNNEIYRGLKVIDRKEISDGSDWAVVKLERAVANHRITDFRRTGIIQNNQAVHVIGHPCGLPTKFAGGARVRDNTSGEFFVANLDTYGGNSGSPVFNSDTHQVEGILVRGATDFASSNGCDVSLVCPSSGCRGEDCTKTTEFSYLFGQENGPEVILLDTTISSMLPDKDSIKEYVIKGIESGKKLIINLEGPEGQDFDLYVKFGSLAKVDDWDSRGYTSDPNEEVTIDPTEQGDYYITVHAFAGKGNFNLKANTMSSEND